MSMLPADTQRHLWEKICPTCNGHGIVQQQERVGECDVAEWEIDCPTCDGEGKVERKEVK